MSKRASEGSTTHERMERSDGMEEEEKFSLRRRLIRKLLTLMERHRLKFNENNRGLSLAISMVSIEKYQ